VKQLTDTLVAHDLTLFHEPTETVILGDTHIGEEEALNDQGIFVPKFAFNDLYKRTQKALDKLNPERIIVNGDIKHNFGYINDDEWDNVITYIELLSQYGSIDIIQGNHDVLLEPIMDQADLTVETAITLDDTFICHGHEQVHADWFDDASTIVLGHEHPSVTLRRGERNEQYKAFVKGRLGDKTVILMPSMNQLREGSDVLQEQLLSPYLTEFDLMEANVFLVGEDKELKAFGELRHLRDIA